MSKIIIFGNQDSASLANYYFTHDSEHAVVAFSVNASFLDSSRLEGLPVVAFENIENDFPPDTHLFFAPVYAKEMNRLRERIYNEIKAKGYRMATYVSSKATVWTERIGDNCFILENNVLQPYSRVCNNVIMWSGNHLGHHSVIHDHVFVTSHVCISGHTEVGARSFLGVGCSIRDNVRIGQSSFIGMGACVVGDTEEWGVYKGVPAKPTGEKSSDVHLIRPRH